ncbi:MAG TPA: MBL fold metallo-hydrolase [Syntrophales bacterium]|nr:MBL fold metallo-hydrolase [Syntrophales bacterium]HOM06598.1 MBL fold metallo-hydrolase [Syntrophales bacterium]HON99619.1 MBL fold metallo-hydrolase [Syntrophales bacterium]HPC00710.1 MBL fold metallo-hydrolase [Syntrophales bacterium]HPQ06140.1 MBL fold metallo-hydrolase [Syntrophales bacterium]
MRHRRAGKVTDNLWYLGREEAGVYLLEGRDTSILINGGISFILPEVLRQMEDFGIAREKIGKVLILHSHFDHVGIVPYLKRTNPDLEIYASPQAWSIFAMPKAIDIMNSFSLIVARQFGVEEALSAYDHAWRDDMTGVSVGEGDKIELGGVSLQIMHTPGHTNCSITAYEPERKALFASDGGGIPFGDTSFPSANTNFTQYAESLERLLPLPVDYLCADHYGYLTGEEAGTFIALTLEETKKWRAYMEDVLRRTGDLDAAARAVTAEFYEKMPSYFLAADILEGVFKQMLKFLAKNMA